MSHIHHAHGVAILVDPEVSELLDCAITELVQVLARLELEPSTPTSLADVREVAVTLREGDTIGRLRVVVQPGAPPLALVDPARARLTPEMLASLTPQQRRVMEYRQGGLANKAIAAKMRISLSTVKFHVRQAYATLEKGGLERPDPRRPLPLPPAPIPPPSFASLSERDQKIARLAGEDLSNAKIGERVGLATNTIGPRLSGIYRTLGLRRADLVRLFLGGSPKRETS